MLTEYTTVLDLRAHPMISGSLDDLPDEMVQSSVDDANDRIDCAMRACHKLPINGIPPTLRMAARVIASYYCLIQDGFNPNVNPSDTLIQQRYYEIVGDPLTPGSGLLHQIAKGALLFDIAIDNGARRQGRPIIKSSPSSDDDGCNYDPIGNAYGINRS